MKDAAQGILDATEEFDRSEPVNLGSGVEISIRNLIETIAELTDFDGDIEWDTSKPDTGNLGENWTSAVPRSTSAGRLRLTLNMGSDRR